MSFLDIFYFFLIYSLIGWLIEVVYIFLTRHKYLRKNSFFRGPFSPIYGFGTLLIILFALPFQSNLFLFLIFTIISTSVLEYFTSLFFDKIFHISWWNYSDEFPNLHGRISLKHSLFWGILSILVFLPSYSFVLSISDFLTQKLGLIGFIIFLVYFIFESINFLKRQSKKF